jgi:hypothetical protein
MPGNFRLKGRKSWKSQINNFIDFDVSQWKYAKTRPWQVDNFDLVLAAADLANVGVNLYIPAIMFAGIKACIVVMAEIWSHLVFSIFTMPHLLPWQNAALVMQYNGYSFANWLMLVLVLALIDYQAKQNVDQDWWANANQCGNRKQDANDININPCPVGKAAAYTKDFFILFVEA